MFAPFAASLAGRICLNMASTQLILIVSQCELVLCVSLFTSAARPLSMGVRCGDGDDKRQTHCTADHWHTSTASNLREDVTSAMAIMGMLVYIHCVSSGGSSVELICRSSRALMARFMQMSELHSFSGQNQKSDVLHWMASGATTMIGR